MVPIGNYCRKRRNDAMQPSVLLPARHRRPGDNLAGRAVCSIREVQPSVTRCTTDRANKWGRPETGLARLDYRQLSLYNWAVIRSIRHRGLKRFYESGGPGRIDAALRGKVQRILSALDAAGSPRSLDFPGFRLHALKGDLEGFWSVTVSGNWRIIFRLEDKCL